MHFNDGSQNYEDSTIRFHECNPDWPVCLYDFTFSILFPQFFCFRMSNEPKIIDNYFSSSMKTETSDASQMFERIVVQEE